MNYQRIYDEIIERAKSRGLNKKLLNYYTEKHHIVPKCLNGTNDKSNLVLLTAREHFICHKILANIYKNVKGLIAAVWFMSYTRFDVDSKIILSSKEYAYIKDEYSKYQTERNYNMTNETKLKIRNGIKKYIENRTAEDIEAHKIRSRKARSGKPSWNSGIKMNDDYKGGMTGKKHSENTKFKIGLANKGRVRSEAAIEKTRIALTGTSISFKDPEKHSRQISLANSGRTWFHNENGETKFAFYNEVDLTIWKKGRKCL